MRFWTVLNRAAIGAAQFDMQGHFVESNPALQQMLGYDEEELRKMNFTELAHPEEAITGTDFWKEMLISGKRESFQTEKRFLRRDGRAIWGRLTLSLIPGGKGRPGSVIGFVDDITQLKRAEGVLQASKAKFWRLLESASDGIVIVNNEGRIVFINAKAEKMFGYDLEELLGKQVEILMPDRFRQTHIRYRAYYYSDLRTRPMAIGRDLYGRRKDGSEFPAQISLSPVESDEEVLIMSTISDITEIKHAEEARLQCIREQAARSEAEAGQQRLKFLCDASKLLASSLDYKATLKGVVQLAVPFLADFCVAYLLQEDGSLLSLEAHTDPSKEGLLREMVRRYPIDPSGPHPLLKVLRSGRPELIPDVSDSFLETIVHDSEHLEMLRALNARSMMVVPLTDRGLALGVILFGSSESGRRYHPNDLILADDLSSHCSLAVDNARLYDRAQKEIAERKRVEEELRKRTKEAEEANRFKSQLVSIVSHDLRAPLNAILGFNRLLKEGRIGEDVTRRNQALDRIHQNAQILLDLINNLLDSSKLEAGRMELKVEEVSLCEIIKEVLLRMSPLADEKGLAIALIDDPLPSIRSDGGKIRQIITNLIANAIKFTSKGSVTVRVMQDADQERVSVQIRDTGIGMGEEERRHLFEPFYQADASDMQDHPGTGLGLSIVKKLLEVLQGSVEVSSAPGGGSTFTVHFPYDLSLQEPENDLERMA